jgi:hypothetical protein
LRVKNTAQNNADRYAITPIAKWRDGRS